MDRSDASIAYYQRDETVVAGFRNVGFVHHLTLEEGARCVRLVLRDPLPASLAPLVRALQTR